jgi:CDK inhibitor PHO81
VFFANYIGDSHVSEEESSVPAGLSFPASQPLAIHMQVDWRCRSIRDAVKFAKSNNLLGLMCQAKLLVCRTKYNSNVQAKVPALIQSIKESGLVLITYGLESEVQECGQIQEGLIDGFMINGVLGFSNAISV